MKTILLIIILLFSSNSFAELKSTEKDLGKLFLDGYMIMQIHTISANSHVYFLKKGRFAIAICNVINKQTECLVDDDAYVEKYGINGN